jgi:hypothetical protein
MLSRPKQPNNPAESCDTCTRRECGECDRVELMGNALNAAVAEFTYETIRYAMSFSERTWYPNRRTLFQIAKQFTEN